MLVRVPREVVAKMRRLVVIGVETENKRLTSELTSVAAENERLAANLTGAETEKQQLVLELKEAREKMADTEEDLQRVGSISAQLEAAHTGLPVEHAAPGEAKSNAQAQRHSAAQPELELHMEAGLERVDGLKDQQALEISAAEMTRWNNAAFEADGAQQGVAATAGLSPAQIESTKILNLHRQRRINRQMQRLVSHMQNRQLSFAFEEWIKKHLHDRRVRHLSNRFGRRMQYVTVSRSYIPWLQQARLERRTRHLTERARSMSGPTEQLPIQSTPYASHEDKSALQTAVPNVTHISRSWFSSQTSADHVAALLADKQVAVDAMKAVEEAERQRHQKQGEATMRRVMRKMDQSLSSQAFSSWRQSVEELVRVRQLMSKALRRIEHSAVVGSFVRWLGAARDAAEGRREAAQSALAAQLEAAEQELAAEREVAMSELRAELVEALLTVERAEADAVARAEAAFEESAELRRLFEKSAASLEVMSRMLRRAELARDQYRELMFGGGGDVGEAGEVVPPPSNLNRRASIPPRSPIRNFSKPSPHDQVGGDSSVLPAGVAAGAEVVAVDTHQEIVATMTGRLRERLASERGRAGALAGDLAEARTALEEADRHRLHNQEQVLRLLLCWLHAALAATLATTLAALAAVVGLCLPFVSFLKLLSPAQTAFQTAQGTLTRTSLRQNTDLLAEIAELETAVRFPPPTCLPHSGTVARPLALFLRTSLQVATATATAAEEAGRAAELAAVHAASARTATTEAAARQQLEDGLRASTCVRASRHCALRVLRQAVVGWQLVLQHEAWRATALDRATPPPCHAKMS